MWKIWDTGTLKMQKMLETKSGWDTGTLKFQTAWDTGTSKMQTIWDRDTETVDINMWDIPRHVWTDRHKNPGHLFKAFVRGFFSVWNTQNKD